MFHEKARMENKLLFHKTVNKDWNLDMFHEKARVES